MKSSTKQEEFKMNKKTNKKAVLVGIGIAICYVIMYIITILKENAIVKLNYYDFMSITKICVGTFLVTIIVVLIPFEDIGYIWKNDLLYKHINVKISDVKKHQLINAVILYLVVALFGIWYKSQFFYSFFKMSLRYSFIITLIVLYVLIHSFELLKKNLSLVVFDLTLIAANGLVLFLYTREFYVAFIVTLALNISWCIYMLNTERKYKLFMIFSSIVTNLFLLLSAIPITGREKKLYAWFNPEKSAFGFEHQVLREHSLLLAKDAGFRMVYRHPFSAIYSYLGVLSLIIFILAFIVMGALVIHSRKLVSKKRYQMMLGIFTIFATLFVYTFFADLGFVPTTSISLIIPFIQIVGVGIMLRIFFKREVSQKIVSMQEFYEKLEMESDDDFEDLLEKRICSQKSQRLKINRDKIAEGLSEEEKEKKCEDGPKVEGKFMRRLRERNKLQ